MAGIAGNAVLGLGMIYSFVAYLKALDELQQKIQLDALAFAMGMGVVSSFSYSLLVTAGFITDAEVSDILVIMVVSYVLGTIVGQVRYR